MQRGTMPVTQEYHFVERPRFYEQQHPVMSPKPFMSSCRPNLSCRHVAHTCHAACMKGKRNVAELPTAAAATTTDDDEHGEDNAEADDMHGDADASAVLQPTATGDMDDVGNNAGCSMSPLMSCPRMNVAVMSPCRHVFHVAKHSMSPCISCRQAFHVAMYFMSPSIPCRHVFHVAMSTCRHVDMYSMSPPCRPHVAMSPPCRHVAM